MRYAILTLLIAAPAFAQEATVWPETVTTAFFADAEFTTIRPTEELRANWALLTEEDRALVRRDCTALAEGTAAPETMAMGAACDALPAP